MHVFLKKNFLTKQTFYLQYYNEIIFPPILYSRMAHCSSRLTLKHVLLAMGVSVWPLTPSSRHLGLRVREPWQYQNLTFTDYLKIR